MPPVLSKRDFVRRYQEGEFGNRGPTWNTLEALLLSPYTGLIHLRNRVANAPTFYNVPMDEVAARYSYLTTQNIRPEDIYFTGMAPHNKNLIQGELVRDDTEYRLFYSTAPGVPMRDALALSGRNAHGAVAVRMLQYYMDDNSYEWTHHLLTEYPGHVVEFSTFGEKWGTVPGFNTVFWEVRLY
jgi:hypothetical protein